MDMDMDFTKPLKTFRKPLRLTQLELAEALGVGLATIWRLEKTGKPMELFSDAMHKKLIAFAQDYKAKDPKLDRDYVKPIDPNFRIDPTDWKPTPKAPAETYEQECTRAAHWIFDHKGRPPAGIFSDRVLDYIEERCRDLGFE